MSILSFGTVMDMFRRSINDATWPGQPKFFCLLFGDYLKDKTDGGIDEGLTSKRMNDKAPLNKEFVNYYKENTRAPLKTPLLRFDRIFCHNFSLRKSRNTQSIPEFPQLDLSQNLSLKSSKSSF